MLKELLRRENDLYRLIPNLSQKWCFETLVNNYVCKLVYYDFNIRGYLINELEKKFQCLFLVSGQ